jgi:hypothetical protein
MDALLPTLYYGARSSAIARRFEPEKAFLSARKICGDEYLPVSNCAQDDDEDGREGRATSTSWHCAAS